MIVPASKFSVFYILIVRFGCLKCVLYVFLYKMIYNVAMFVFVLAILHHKMHVHTYTHDCAVYVYLI